jgi:hypothetical protein
MSFTIRSHTALSFDKNQTANSKPLTSSNNCKVFTLESIKSTGTAQTIKNVLDSMNGKCAPLEEDRENRFEIIIGYNKDLIDLFKTFSSRRYDPNSKRWNFSLEQYDEIINRIKDQFNGTIKLDPLDSRSNKSTVQASSIKLFHIIILLIK